MAFTRVRKKSVVNWELELQFSWLGLNGDHVIANVPAFLDAGDYVSSGEETGGVHTHALWIAGMPTAMEVCTTR